MTADTTGSTELYRLEELRFSYGNKLALALPSLDIKAGKTTALIGPNGSGKSTLLNLLAFLDSPQHGNIAFKGKTVQANQLLSLRKRIGFLAQKPYMLRGSVADNLKLALKLHDIPKKLWPGKINRALERLNALHLQDRKANSLSGGELQKAALARALINDPEVLLLDEPFSYLDQTANEMLEEFIQNYGRETNTNLIFSTHNRLQGLALADEVVTLVNGSLVQTPLLNLFHGTLDNHLFNTGKLTVVLTGDVEGCRHISIDPHEIVLSKQPFCSSIRNQYPGRITAISEEMGKVRVAVAAGEIFQALITFEALTELQLHLGNEIWVSFKSNSIVTF